MNKEIPTGVPTQEKKKEVKEVLSRQKLFYIDENLNLNAIDNELIKKANFIGDEVEIGFGSFICLIDENRYRPIDELKGTILKTLVYKKLNDEGNLPKLVLACPDSPKSRGLTGMEFKESDLLQGGSLEEIDNKFFTDDTKKVLYSENPEYIKEELEKKIEKNGKNIRNEQARRKMPEHLIEKAQSLEAKYGVYSNSECSAYSPEELEEYIALLQDDARRKDCIKKGLLYKNNE